MNNWNELCVLRSNIQLLIKNTLFVKKVWYNLCAFVWPRHLRERQAQPLTSSVLTRSLRVPPNIYLSYWYMEISFCMCVLYGCGPECVELTAQLRRTTIVLDTPNFLCRFTLWPIYNLNVSYEGTFFIFFRTFTWNNAYGHSRLGLMPHLYERIVFWFDAHICMWKPKCVMFTNLVIITNLIISSRPHAYKHTK